MTRLVEVADLHVVARDETGVETSIVRQVGFSIAAGEVLALIGESGSGKTTTALALMGYARHGCRIVGGRIRVGGDEITMMSRSELAVLRGRRIAYIAQSAAAAFNPAQRIMTQVIESARIHKLMSRAEAEAKAVALFRALALPDPETVGRRYPHQVSGGQLQRLMAAMALISDPELVIMDEPTTALDVTTQIEVLRAFKSVIRDKRTTAIYVSHDLSVVAQMADHILVLKDGETQETGPTERLLTAPSSSYTKSLIAAVRPAERPTAPEGAARVKDTPLLKVTGVTAGYGGMDTDGLPRIPVLEAVDLTIRRGTTLGIIGESGCGKSTLARVIAGLHPPATGTITLDGSPLAPRAAERSRDELRRTQIVFQMADTALNPGRSVERILGRPLAFYHGLAGEARRRRVAELLDMVRLPVHLAGRYPDELSGGQKQRVNLARALAAEPDLILCDEVISALDTVVGAAVLDLLAELKRELGLAYMFISHDLSTVRAICDEVMILYAGRRVELGERHAAMQPPMHPYAALLISSVPELDAGWLDALPPARPTCGDESEQPQANWRACAFFPRCPARIEGLCDTEQPPLQRLAKGTEILCHQSEAELKRLQAEHHATSPAPHAATPTS